MKSFFDTSKYLSSPFPGEVGKSVARSLSQAYTSNLQENNTIAQDACFYEGLGFIGAGRVPAACVGKSGGLDILQGCLVQELDVGGVRQGATMPM